MRRQFLALLLAGILALCFGQSIQYVIDNPASTGDVYWGLTSEMTITPQLSDLLSADAATINNTNLQYTLTSYPGCVQFTPSVITFGVTLTPTAPATVTDPADITFTPDSVIVRFVAIDISVANLDPIWEIASADTTNGYTTPAHFPIDLGVVEACVNGSARCTGVTDVQFNVSAWIFPELRPIYLASGGVASLSDNGYIGVFSDEVLPSQPSRDYRVFLPLSDGSDNTIVSDTVVTGTATAPEVRWATPGRDNAGGTLSISIHSIWRLSNDSVVFEQVTDGVAIRPATMVISALKPTAVFTATVTGGWSVTNQTGTVEVDAYYVFFSVVENSTAPSLVADAGFPLGAYTLMGLALHLRQTSFQFLDFPVSQDGFIPISPQRIGYYRYHFAIVPSPMESGMGLNGTVSYSFVIDPPGAITILVATSSAPDSFVPVNAFVFTGAQRVIEFMMLTQETPSGPGFVNLTFTDLVTSPPRSEFEFSLQGSYLFDIVPNAIDIFLTPDFASDNILSVASVGQPMWLSFEWAPPTLRGFTVTMTALELQYPDGRVGGNYTFTVGAGLTKYVAGPFVPLESVVERNWDSDWAVVINLALLPLSASVPGATADDHSWYTLASFVSFPVSRDRIYLLNSPKVTYLPPISLDTKKDQAAIIDNQYPVYELSLAGIPSEPMCIGVSLYSNFFANDQQEIWVTPWSMSLNVHPYEGEAVAFRNRSGLIFVATGNPPPASNVSRDGMPAGTVVLSRANNGTACFTVAFDPNFPYLSEPVVQWRELMQSIADQDITGYWDNVVGLWQIQIAVGGPNSNLVFERDSGGSSQLLRLPQYFLVKQPSIDWQLFINSDEMVGPAHVINAGDTVEIYITLSQPTQKGLNYGLSCTGCTFEQLNVTLVDGLPGFPTGSVGPHLWRINFDRIVTNTWRPFFKRDQFETPYGTDVQFWAYGNDAAVYRTPEKLSFAVTSRPITVTVVRPTQNSPGYITDYIKVELERPVIAGVTLTPYLFGNDADDLLVFDPPQLDFLPGGNQLGIIRISVNPEKAPYQFGIWTYSFRLTGPDANFTVFNEGVAIFETITIGFRRAPIVTNPLDAVGEMVAGVPYGPFRIELEDPLLPDESDLTLSLEGPGFTFEPAQVTFVPGELTTYVSVRWDPLPDAPQAGDADMADQILFSLSGTEAWKYARRLPPQIVTLTRRDVALTLADPVVVVGVPHTGVVDLALTTPSSVLVTLLADGVTFSPSTVQFDVSGGLRQFFTFTVDTDFPISDDVESNEITIQAIVSGEDTPYYNPISFAQFQVVRRSFVMDATFSANTVYMLNRPSPVYTISVVGEPSSPLTVTFSSEYLEFSPETLTFVPGVLTQSFSFTPIAIPATQSYVTGSAQSSFVDTINVAVDGAEADSYSWEELENLQKIFVVPELDVSPILPIYTDGESDDIFVSVKNDGRIATSLPDDVGAWNGFTLHIDSDLPEPGVSIEPRVLEFSPRSSSMMRKFRIRHIQPTVFGTKRSYSLSYRLRFAGTPDNEIHDFILFDGVTNMNMIPAHAQQVILRRYNIIPGFPKVLSFGWQEASFNLTRVNKAHMTLTPHMSLPDGNEGPFLPTRFGGHATPGGRVQFDPPVVVFAPGQVVQSFMVKALPGADDQAVYMRVQWQISGNDEDAMNFIEYVDPRDSTHPFSVHSHFATWHVAGAALAQLSILAVCLLFSVVLVVIM